MDVTILSMELGIVSAGVKSGINEGHDKRKEKIS
jgi:hypothetical protein